MVIVNAITLYDKIIVNPEKDDYPYKFSKIFFCA